MPNSRRALHDQRGDHAVESERGEAEAEHRKRHQQPARDDQVGLRIGNRGGDGPEFDHRKVGVEFRDGAPQRLDQCLRRPRPRSTTVK